MRFKNTVLLVLLCAVAPACGAPSNVVLNVSLDCGGSDCLVPDEAEALSVTLFEVPPEGDAIELGADIFALTPETTFPVRILLQFAISPKSRLRERVAVMVGGTEVASNLVEHSWAPGKTNETLVDIDVPGTP